MAQTTGTGSDTSNTGSGTGNDGYMQLERCWERSAFRITSISGTIGGGLSFNAGDILDTELEADAGASVSFERIDQYEITCPGTTIPQTVECQVREWENCSSSGCPCSV